MFPLIISSFLTEEEKNSKKIPVFKLVGLLILAVFLISPFVIGRIFESKEKNNSGKVAPLISIGSVIAGGGGDGGGGDGGGDCGMGCVSLGCAGSDCAGCVGDSCAAGGGDGGAGPAGGAAASGDCIGTNVGPGEGPGPMGSEATATVDAMPGLGEGMTATSAVDGSAVSGSVVSVSPVTGVEGIDAIATTIGENGLVGVAVSISAPSADCGCGGDCACGCIASTPETCPPGSVPSPTIPPGYHSVKTIPAP